MQCEVIVVGAGIGGLTVAAMLAARGVDVCLLERQSHVGGCVATFEHLDRAFDPTFGLHSGWEPGGVWERIFANLPVAPPQVTELDPNFVVCLPDGKHVAVSSDPQGMKQNIATAFPECANEAVQFIRAVTDARGNQQTIQLPKNLSHNFRAFLDVQLAALTQCTIEHLQEPRAVAALKLAVGKMWHINGSADLLAKSLAQGFKESGGHLRLDSPVLRLAYGSDGIPIGVDLLSGERVTATRAIISNLTVWDTYGKLVGLSHTPRPISAALNQTSGWGVYQIFMVIEEAAIASLPAPRMFLTSDVDDASAPVPHIMLHITHDSSGSKKRAATLTRFTYADDWFEFHEDASWHEELDQATLEKVWTRLSEALPEITAAAEVFETATPQTYYESFRRKMGMIGSSSSSPLASATTPFPNLFIVGDTATSEVGLAGLAEAAERLVASFTA